MSTQTLNHTPRRNLAGLHGLWCGIKSGHKTYRQDSQNLTITAPTPAFAANLEVGI